MSCGLCITCKVLHVEGTQLCPFSDHGKTILDLVKSSQEQLWKNKPLYKMSPTTNSSKKPGVGLGYILLSDFLSLSISLLI